MDSIKAIVPTGHIGWQPFSEESFKTGLGFGPDFIAAQAGSNDNGPLYLGSDAQFSKWQKHDIELMLLGAMEQRVPMIIGGAGDVGTNSNVKYVTDLVKEVAKKHDLHFKMAIIKSEQDQDYLIEKLQKGCISPLGIEAPLTEETIRKCSKITAMMGVEPFVKALSEGANVIIAGRCTDPAIFAAFPLWKGFDAGMSWYMGKACECACLVAAPISISHTITAKLEHDRLYLTPASPHQTCTIASVAGHSLYERMDPYLQNEPGGALKLEGLEYRQVNDRTVEIRGARFEPRPYDVRLEGASLLGYRAISVFGIRDPILISKIDQVIEEQKKEVSVTYGGSDYRFTYHIYGRDAVMQELEIDRSYQPREIGVVIECVAETPQLSEDICTLMQHLLLHTPYEGILGTSGNIGLLGSVDVFVPVNREVYEYSIDHVLRLDSPYECVQFDFIDL